MQLIVKTDLEKQLPAIIEWNNEEIKADLTEKLKVYNSMVVTEDTISSAKKDRASLNKLRDTIENRRKDIKKQCLAPYENFEKSVKEIVAMIDAPIALIDGQLKAFDDGKKQAKRNEIVGYYGDHIGELADLIPLERIYNPKWTNATVSIDVAKAELQASIDKAKNDIGIIRNFGTDYQSQMIDTYLRTLDMISVLSEKNRLEAQDAAIKAMHAKASASESKPVPTESAEPEIAMPSVNLDDHFREATKMKEETKTIKVIFYGTTADFRSEMKALTDKYHVKYGGMN